MTNVQPARFENGNPLLIAGLRGHFTTPDGDGISKQWERFEKYLRLPGQVGSVTYGLCFMTASGFDYLCGADVSSDEGLPTEFTTVRIPAQRYAVFVHPENVRTIRTTLEAIHKQWVPPSGVTLAEPAPGSPNFFERYGEKFDPRSGYGDIEVWIPVRSDA